MDNEYIEKCYNDFKFFLIEVFKFLGLPKPTEMQLYVADYVQGLHKRLQLQAFRGLGKTTIVGAYVCWRLFRNANEKVLIISQTGGHADNIAIFIRSLIYGMDILKHLIPGKNQKDTNTEFVVSGSETAVQPSVKSLGITSQLQGRRASILISDDIEGQQNSGTEKRRQDLLKQAEEFENILQTNEDAQILVLGTPQSSESIYNRLEKKGYLVKKYPARYPSSPEAYDGNLADYLKERLINNPSLSGTPTDSRFGEEDLIRREQSSSTSGFKLQFLLDTSLSDNERFPLKTSDIIVTDLSPTVAPSNVIWSSRSSEILNEIPNIGFTGDVFRRPLNEDSDRIEYEGSILSIDPSGRGKDETGVAVVNHLHGNIYVPFFTGLSGGYDESMLEIAEIAKKYKVNKIVIESNFGDGMYSKLLTPILNAIYPCGIEEIRNSIQKEKRIIDTLEPLLNQHRLVMDYSCIKSDVNRNLQDTSNIYNSLIYQLTHINYDRNCLPKDDRLDALTIGVQYWNNYGILKQNSKDALKEYKHKQLEKELSRLASVYNNFNRLGKVSNNISPILSSLDSFK